MGAKLAIASRYWRTDSATSRRRVDRRTRGRAGHGDARRESLHVPLERPRERLVEIVDAEDEAPVRRREDPEVREVRVTAELGVKTRPRPGGESAAIRYAPPRKNANGEPSMRP